MEKKGTGLSKGWSKRWFELRGRKLMYFTEKSDTAPKFTFHLHSGCKVDRVSDEPRKKMPYRFRITWPAEGEGAGEESEEEEEEGGADAAAGGASRPALDSPKQAEKSISGTTATSSSTSSSSSPISLQAASLDATETPGGAAGSNGNGGRAGGPAVPSLSKQPSNTAKPRGLGSAMSTKERPGAGGAGGGGKDRDKSGWWSNLFNRSGGQGNPEDPSRGGGHHGKLELACETLAERTKWIEALEKSIDSAGPGGDYGQLRGGVQSPQRRTAPPGIRMREVEDWLKSSDWKVCTVVDGIRILEQCGGDEYVRIGGGSGTPKVEVQGPSGLPDLSHGASAADSQSAAAPPLPPHRTHDYSQSPCYRVNVCVNQTPKEVWNSVMFMPPGCRTGYIRQMRIVESIDNATDVVHIVLDPIYLHPTWTAPRDLCLLRYWKETADKNYIVCFDSTFHQDCPLVDGFVRADLHATYVISPTTADEDESVESLLTYIAQMDPRGWVWRSCGYQHSMLHAFMLHVLDIRDSADADRFVQVRFDPSQDRRLSVVPESASVQRALSALGGGNGSSGGSGNGGGEGGLGSDAGVSLLGSIPPPTLPAEMWSEPDATTFRLRGKSYPQDKQKVLSEPSLFKLVAVDVFEVPEPTRNIAANPKNRVYLAQQRGDPAWCFVMNIMVPGPPHLCFVVYLEGDKSKIEEDTPFGRIARPFFHGNDDEFRNNRFKLIPRVVDGNMIIKMAVKDTPTLLGNKLKQYYFRGDNYFELDVDVGSSSVARCVSFFFYPFSLSSLGCLSLGGWAAVVVCLNSLTPFSQPPSPTPPPSTPAHPQASGGPGHRLLARHRGGHGHVPARERGERAARGHLRRLQVPTG